MNDEPTGFSWPTLCSSWSFLRPLHVAGETPTCCDRLALRAESGRALPAAQTNGHCGPATLLLFVSSALGRSRSRWPARQQFPFHYRAGEAPHWSGGKKWRRAAAGGRIKGSLRGGGWRQLRASIGHFVVCTRERASEPGGRSAGLLAPCAHLCALANITRVPNGLASDATDTTLAPPPQDAATGCAYLESRRS